RRRRGGRRQGDLGGAQGTRQHDGLLRLQHGRRNHARHPVRPARRQHGRGARRVRLPRRAILRLAAAAAALPLVGRRASALDYPSRPVRLIVPYPGGGAPDIVARLVAKSLSERCGQQFIVDNRAGAGGNIGTDMVAKASPDGYTLLLAVSTNAVNVTLYEHLNFNFLHDFAPIGMIGTLPFAMLTYPGFPAKTLDEFIAYAKAIPARSTWARRGSARRRTCAASCCK